MIKRFLWCWFWYFALKNCVSGWTNFSYSSSFLLRFFTYLPCFAFSCPVFHSFVVAKSANNVTTFFFKFDLIVVGLVSKGSYRQFFCYAEFVNKPLKLIIPPLLTHLTNAFWKAVSLNSPYCFNVCYSWSNASKKCSPSCNSYPSVLY